MIPPLPVNILEGLPPLSENSQTVLTKRYLDRDEKGNIRETHDELFWRVAYFVARNGHLKEKSEDVVMKQAVKYFKMLRSGDFLPNSPTLANAGTRTGQLSACFVIPVSDAFSNGSDGIYDALNKAQLIQQTGGGVGYSFSRLRRKGAIVSTTKGIASGPVSFMDVFDVACEKMKQGGTRRGAQMGILRVDHPDIMEFIDYKQDLSKLTNFNVSVGITDAFLEALEKNADFQLVDPLEGPLDTWVPARDLWNRIITRAHSTGEPGVVFLDRMNRHNPTPKLGPYEATNPCGEQPLNPYESCNLGSITLDNMVSYDSDNNPYLDDEKLQHTVWLATQFMDDVVDANEYVPRVPEIKETTLKTRKLGLGIMGLARMLCKLQIAYNSEEGRSMAEHVYAFIDLHSKAASTEIARAVGAYPYFMDNIEESIEFFRRDLTERANVALQSGLEEVSDGYFQVLNELEKHGIRNSTTTTIAPTGTISMVADTSGGCEPLFALAFKRFQAETVMVETDKIFKQALVDANLSPEQIDTILEAVTENEGSLLRALPKIKGVAPEALLQKLAGVFVTAGDITPEDHVLMQAALQKYCDSAISKTVNAPEDYTVEETAKVYDLALKTNCKGVTIYRNNSRQFQPLSTGPSKTEEKVEVSPEECPNCKGADLMAFELFAANALSKVNHSARERPGRLFGFNDRIETEQGKLYVQINYDNAGIREVVANLGKGGGVLSSLVEAIGRLLSVALKHHTPVQDLSQSLRGIRGGSPNGFGPKQTLSIPDAIGKVLEASPEQLYVTTSEAESLPEPEPIGVIYPANTELHVAEQPEKHLHPVRDLGHSPECPECGGSLVFSEGCMSCPRCFTSKCS